MTPRNVNVGAAGAVLSFAAAAHAANFPSTAGNMNGAYVLAPTPNGKDVNAKFPLAYKDYPGGVEYFDVYSPPIKTLYSQVFWKATAPVQIPQAIRDKYRGRGMAVVGFEADQVRRGSDGTDIPVPITVAYNHHFEVTVAGADTKASRMVFDGPHDPRREAIIEARRARGHDMGHGIPDEYYHVEDVRAGPTASGAPNSMNFGGSNGGEYRKSFHGTAPGYVRAIHAPESVIFTPMQIDTWHRDAMNVSHPTRFVPGPLPRSSLAPVGPAAFYSGLLECPVTTRIAKVLAGGYDTRAAGHCPARITSADECFAAGRAAFGGDGTAFAEVTRADPSLPPACQATVDGGAPARITLLYNDAGGGVACGGAGGRLSGATQSLVNVRVDVDAAGDVVTLTLAGPADVWFGVGFNASAMADAPWAVIAEGTGDVSERRLGDHQPGAPLAASIAVVSNTVAGGVRTVVATRALRGAGGAYYTFDVNTAAAIPFINAVGAEAAFGYHKEKTGDRVSLLPAGGGAGTCLCAPRDLKFGEGKGTLHYRKTSQAEDTGSGSVGWGNTCKPRPGGDLLAESNPACDLRTYVGGQIACHHMWSLLDAEQEIPWADQPIEYHLKFRFWVQPYDPAAHKLVREEMWGIASPVEYDVPKCNASIDDCTRAADGSWVHTIRGTYEVTGTLVGAHFHCHAPTCLYMAMYRCDKALGLDGCNATTGELLCEQRPVYGGAGHMDDARFDEPGFITQPPCLWGAAAQGLEPPQATTGYIMHSVKQANATYGHHGEMAWQQVMLVS